MRMGTSEVQVLCGYVISTGGNVGKECALCERPTPDQYLEKHHVTPKSKGGKETIGCCVACADQLHQLFTNKELANMTFGELKTHPKVWKWIKWIRTKKNFVVCMKRKK